MINLYQLEIFLTVVEEGNFSAAAKKLHMTQPAISLQMRAMEERYSLKLFERRGQKLEPTEQAQQLLTAARELMDFATKTERSFLSLSQQAVGGKLTLAVATEFGLRQLPGLLARFQLACPTISVSVPSRSEGEATAALRSGDLDCALFGSIPGTRSFEWLPLLTDELVLAVPPNHPWSGLAGDEALTLGELAVQPLILPPAGSEMRAVIEEAFEERGLISREVKPSLELAGAEEIALAIEAGAGVGFVPRSRLATLLAEVNYPFNNVDGVPTALSVPLTTYLVRASRQPASPAAASFWQFAKADRD